MTEPRNEAEWMLSAAYERIKRRAFSAERSLEVAQARIRELEAERDRLREALEHLRDHYEPSIGTNYVCAGMAEYVCEVANRALSEGDEDE